MLWFDLIFLFWFACFYLVWLEVVLFWLVLSCFNFVLFLLVSICFGMLCYGSISFCLVLFGFWILSQDTFGAHVRSDVFLSLVIFVVVVLNVVFWRQGYCYFQEKICAHNTIRSVMGYINDFLSLFFVWIDLSEMEVSEALLLDSFSSVPAMINTLRVKRWCSRWPFSSPAKLVYSDIHLYLFVCGGRVLGLCELYSEDKQLNFLSRVQTSFIYMWWD